MAGRRPGWVAAWRIAGVAVTVAALGYLLQRLGSQLPQLAGLDVIGPQIAALVVVGSLVYATLLVLVAVAWGVLLRGLGQTAGTWAAIEVYSRANIAKYLPGNVLQIAGRQLLGARFGWQQARIASATLAEGAVQVACGLALGVGVAAVLGLATSDLVPSSAVGVLAVLVLFAVAVVNARLLRGAFDLRRFLRHAAAAGGMYVVYYAGSSMLVFILAVALGGDGSAELVLSSVVGFVLGWLAGFVTPGAPGGLGVREVVMTSVLTPLVGEALALALVLLFRVITIAGDALVFGFVVIGARWTRRVQLNQTV